MPSDSTIAQLQEAISHRRYYLTPQIIHLYDDNDPRVQYQRIGYDTDQILEDNDIPDSDQASDHDILNFKSLTMKISQPEQISMTIILPNGREVQKSVSVEHGVKWSTFRSVIDNASSYQGHYISVDSYCITQPMNLFQYPFHDEMIVRCYLLFKITLTGGNPLRFFSNYSFEVEVHGLMTIKELINMFLEKTGEESPRIQYHIFFNRRCLRDSDTIEDAEIQPGNTIKVSGRITGCPCGGAKFSDQQYLFLPVIPEHPNCPYRVSLHHEEE